MQYVKTVLISLLQALLLGTLLLLRTPDLSYLFTLSKSIDY